MKPVGSDTAVSLVRERFGVDIDSFSKDKLLEVRDAVDRAKILHAFGTDSQEVHRDDLLCSELLWHFDFWRLRELRESGSLTPPQILPPDSYRNAAELFHRIGTRRCPQHREDPGLASGFPRAI